jgi:heme exporter protein D
VNIPSFVWLILAVVLVLIVLLLVGHPVKIN